MPYVLRSFEQHPGDEEIDNLDEIHVRTTIPNGNNTYEEMKHYLVI